MRATFTLEVLSRDGKYPSNTEIVEYLRSFGWDLAGGLTSEKERTKKYIELFNDLKDFIPELPVHEANSVIFVGLLQGYISKFIVFRSVDNQVTFRVLHTNLSSLQRAGETILVKILQKQGSDNLLEVGIPRVGIYEFGSDVMIMRGRIITNPLREVDNENRRDVILFVISFFLAILSAVVLLLFPQNSILFGIFRELLTASLAVSLVSLFGLLQTYIGIVVQTKSNKRIVWSASDSIL